MAGETCPRWLVGKHCQVSVTALTCDETDGSLDAVVGQTKSLVGKCERFELRADPRIEEISAMDAAVENDVPLKKRFEMTITEITKIIGSDLEDLYFAYDFFMIVAIKGKRKVTFFCTRGPANFTYETGRAPAQVTFRQIDTGQINPLLETIA